MIKLFESFKEYDQVKQWLGDMGIENYTINDDLTVDVDGSVFIGSKAIKEIPLQFGRIHDTFDIGNNRLTSLEGCPSYVGARFNCSGNNLTTLKGCPQYVGSQFWCASNVLTSLEYAPKYIGSETSVSNNRLTSLEGLPKQLNGFFDCTINKINTLKGAPQFIENIKINTDYLPKEITSMISHYEMIFKHQEEYGIWNSDGSFNKARWNILVNDIENNILD